MTVREAVLNRVAVLSDIHGVLPALEAVLAEPDVSGADRISVGMPYRRPGAHWCLLGPGTDLRVTPYDIPAAVARLRAECGYPDIAEWADRYLNSRVTDTEALTVFGPGDGRAGATELP